MTTSTEIKSRVARPAEGRVFSMMGVTIRPVVTSQDSDGAITVLEQDVVPGGGSPPHILRHGHKTIYVVHGEFRVLVGKLPIEASAGTTVFIPEGVVHNFTNIGQAAGRLLIMVTPGGHEQFLEELAEAAKEGKPGPEVMSAIGARHGVEMVAPAVA